MERAKRLSKVQRENNLKNSIRRGEDSPKIHVVKINSEIGYGVFAKEEIQKNEYLCEYDGEKISIEEGTRRLSEEGESFIYFFEKGKTRFCVDASTSSRICKFVNDSSKEFVNCLMKTIIVDDEVRLGLFSADVIPKGRELRYNYGDVSHNLWWRDKTHQAKYTRPFNIEDCENIDASHVDRENVLAIKKDDFFEIENIGTEKFIQMIGKGSVATVHRCDLKGKTFAVKTFFNTITPRLFRKCVRPLTRLHHENVIKYCGLINQPQSLVMEYCEYNIFSEAVHNVREMIDILNDENSFVFADRLSIVCQSGRGLIYLHNCGIIHRDFKPANLLLAMSNGPEMFSVKICDFDSVLTLKNTVSRTQTNIAAPVGCTLAYTANEICLRESSVFNEKTDTYSWAVTAYEVLSNLFYAWQEVLPILNDELLRDALRKNERPHLNHLFAIYGSNSPIFNIIKSSWHYDQNERLKINEEILKEIENSVSRTDQMFGFEPEDKHDSRKELLLENIDQILDGVSDSSCFDDDLAYLNLYKPSESGSSDDDFDVTPLLSGIFEVSNTTIMPNEDNVKGEESFLDCTVQKLSVIILEDMIEEAEKTMSGTIDSSVEQVVTALLKDTICKVEEETLMDLAVQKLSEIIVEDMIEEVEKNMLEDTISEVGKEFPKDSDVHFGIDDNSSDDLYLKRKKRKFACFREKEELFKSPPKKKPCLHKKISSNSKRPPRPCYFCGDLQTQLKRHMKRKHKTKSALRRLVKSSASQQRLIVAKLRKEGIKKHNINELNKKEPKLLCHERAVKGKTATSNDLIMCSECSGFFWKSSFRRHRWHCSIDGIRSAGISASYIKVTVLDKFSKEYKETVISSLRDDSKGQFIKKNSLILTIGGFLFEKVKRKENKKYEISKSVRQDLRQLASLYQVFLKEEGVVSVTNDVKDLFRQENFQIFQKAVETFVEKENGEIKSGLKYQLLYLVKNVCKILKGYSLIKKHNEDVQAIDNFLAVLELLKDCVFGDATYQLKSQRRKVLRRPSQLPDEEDIVTFRSFLLRTLNELTNDPFSMMTKEKYILLRKALCARLTLYNGRRGGEPARLTVKEAQDALDDSWLSRQDLKILKKRFKKSKATFKVTFQPGKGEKDVAVLFPSDTIPALEMLLCPQNRKDSGLVSSNTFLFASTSSSRGHQYGWQAIFDMARLAGVNPTKMTATKNRKYVSTKLAAVDMDRQERDQFFKHMGHSKDINENVYQVLPAMKEILYVGKHLDNLDKGLISRDVTNNTSISGTSSRIPPEDESVENSLCGLPDAENESAENVLSRTSSRIPSEDEPVENSLCGTSSRIPPEDESVENSLCGLPDAENESAENFLSHHNSEVSGSYCPKQVVVNISPLKDFRKSYHLRQKRVLTDKEAKIDLGSTTDGITTEDDDGSDSDYDFSKDAKSTTTKDDDSDNNEHATPKKAKDAKSTTTEDDDCDNSEHATPKKAKMDIPKNVKPKKWNKWSNLKNSTSEKKFNAWTPNRAEAFFNKFDDYISGKKSKCYPSNEEMQNFLDRNKINFTLRTVRVKISNEKEKHKRKVAQLKRNLGIND